MIRSTCPSMLRRMLHLHRMLPGSHCMMALADSPMLQNMQPSSQTSRSVSQNQSEVIARPEPLSIGAAPEVAPPQPPLRGGAAEEGRRRNAKRSSRKKDPRRRGDAVELWKPFAKKAAADGQ
uniref:Uncharacterized protein n=1 Tax=Eutreptiella gymnastica TaxID=73025 RepID=A0A7S4G434_9EUGL